MKQPTLINTEGPDTANNSFALYLKEKAIRGGSFFATMIIAPATGMPEEWAPLPILG